MSSSDDKTTDDGDKKMIETVGEPLLDRSDNRFVLFPIKYPEIYALYQKHVASFWNAKEIKFTSDLKDWDTLSDEEKHYIKTVLAFFAASDGIVAENLALKFYSAIDIPEVRLFYGFQLAMEGIHSETYSLLIDTYISDKQDKSRLLNAIHTLPTIAKKANWALKWIEGDASFAESLVAFAFVEGVFFSASFCSIFWIKRTGKLPALSQSNQLISRDEGLHCDFACLLYSMLKNRLTEERVCEILVEAVDIEKDYVSSALPVSLLGMNCAEMCKYIEFVADRLLVQLDYNRYYKTENPFDWMEMISLDGSTNFFEHRVTEYAIANNIDISDNNLDNDDF